MINTNPATWYDARWPYPRPSVIRQNCQWVDYSGRCYIAVSGDDAGHLGLNRFMQWYWCALPASKSKDVGPLEVGDKIKSDRGTHSVRDVSLDVMPRRSVMIVAIK
jgi:hypothetical protein